MDSIEAQKDFSVSSDQQRIKPTLDPNINDFEFHLNENEKDEIFAYFKFKVEDLIDPILWSQISHNEEIQEEKNQLLFLDEGHQDFQKYIKTKQYSFNIIDEIKFEVIFRPKKVFPREKHIALNISYFVDVINEDKCNFNGLIDIYSRGYCNNLREKLIQKKKTFYISSKCQHYSINVMKKLFPNKADEILWEIRFEPQTVLAQEEGLPIGLINLGVTCYMNSYLQTMFHLKQFRKYVANLDNEDKEDSFLFALQSLFYQMQQMKKAPANTHALVKSFQWDLTQIFTQQDVQEFSFMFFEAIEAKSKQQGIKNDIIKELFEGKMESFIKCINIEYVSKREEIFTDVQLVIKGQNNIYQALSNHFKSIKLEGDNAYQTEGYGKQDAEKGLRFKNMPKILTFQLNRFEFQYEFEQNIKINDKFEFYEEIDLQQFCEQNIQHCKYQLFAVNSHIGLQANSGHYKAFIKINEQWLEFDDEMVTKVDLEYVEKNSFGGKYKDISLDTRNFGLKTKKRQAYGHAYRLVYIQQQVYDQIVNNQNEVVQFSENIKEKNDKIIEDLEKSYFEREHFNLVFTFKDNFLGKETGLNGLFFKKFHLDDFTKYLDKKNLIELQLKKTINRRNFFAIIEKTFDLENNCSEQETQSEEEELEEPKHNRFYTLYIYREKFGCLQVFNFDQFVQYCDEESKFYFYLDVHNQQLADEKLIVIKSFELQSLKFVVEDIFSLDSGNTMETVLGRLNLKEPYICKKQQYQNKYEDIDEKQQVKTNNASSEIVIILLRNAEAQDWQIFDKFYNNMYFKIQINLYYNQGIYKFIFQMNMGLKEQLKKIKEFLQIPQDKTIIVSYQKRMSYQKHQLSESSVTEEEDSQGLSSQLYKNPNLEINLEENEDDEKSHFSIFIFGLQGLQIISNNKNFDDVKTIQDLTSKIQNDNNYLEYNQLLQNSLECLNLEIFDYQIQQLHDQRCCEPPQNFQLDKQYCIICTPAYRYRQEDANYCVKLRFYENGNTVYHFPYQTICLPNLTKEELIAFFREYFSIMQPYGQMEQQSTYVIKDNIGKFKYSRSIGEEFSLEKTEDKDLDQMCGELKKVIFSVQFYMRQQKQKTGIKINVQLYLNLIIYQCKFFCIVQNVKKFIIKRNQSLIFWCILSLQVFQSFMLNHLNTFQKTVKQNCTFRKKILAQQSMQNVYMCQLTT